MNGYGRGEDHQSKSTGSVVTRETFGMTLLVFSLLLLVFSIIGSYILGEIGVAITAFLYGVFGYFLYPVLALCIYTSLVMIIGKKFLPGKWIARTFAVAAAAFLIAHLASSARFYGGGFGSYLGGCWTAAETSASGATAGGVLMGLICYPLRALLTAPGAYVAASLLCVGAVLYFLSGTPLFRLFSRREKESRQIRSAVHDREIDFEDLPPRERDKETAGKPRPGTRDAQGRPVGVKSCIVQMGRDDDLQDAQNQPQNARQPYPQNAQNQPQNARQPYPQNAQNQPQGARQPYPQNPQNQPQGARQPYPQNPQNQPQDSRWANPQDARERQQFRSQFAEVYGTQPQEAYRPEQGLYRDPSLSREELNDRYGLNPREEAPNRNWDSRSILFSPDPARDYYHNLAYNGNYSRQRKSSVQPVEPVYRDERREEPSRSTARDYPLKQNSELPSYAQNYREAAERADQPPRRTIIEQKPESSNSGFTLRPEDLNYSRIPSYRDLNRETERLAPEPNDSFNDRQKDEPRDRFSDRNDDRFNDRLNDEPRDRFSDRVNDEPRDRFSDRKDDRFSDRLNDETRDRFSDRKDDRFSDRLNDEPRDRFSDRNDDRFSDRVNDEPRDRFSDRNNDRISDRLNDEPRDRFSDRLNDETRDRFSDRNNDRFNDRLNDEPRDRFNDRNDDRFSDKVNDEPRDRFSDRKDDRFSDRLSDEPRDRFSDRNDDRFSDRLSDEPRDRFSDRNDDRFSDRLNDEPDRFDDNSIGEVSEQLPSLFPEKEELQRGEETDVRRDAVNDALGRMGFGESRALNGIRSNSELFDTDEPDDPLPDEQPKPKAKKHVYRPYHKPSLSLLRQYDDRISVPKEEIERNSSIIIDTLAGFRVDAEIMNVTCGPSVTRYDIDIPRNISLSAVTKRSGEIAMRLHARDGVNMYANNEAGTISIEVPNSVRATVGLASVMQSEEYLKDKPGALMFAIGKDIEGRNVCGNIPKMTHILVAGTTNAGKSVALNAMLVSLICKYSPEELRLILVDPKRTEFIVYDGLPHLMINEIIGDAQKAIMALNWSIKEMERRYALFEQKTRSGVAVRNVDEYNENLTEDEEKLPKIVFVVDELADLMSVAKKDIEERIQRLTQKARAAGIHLVLATQRPSVDVITGVIKGNLPTRMAVRVIQEVDSRTILDESGAEKLLGMGDMLFKTGGMFNCLRVQGAFIATDELQAIVEDIKQNNESYFDPEVSEYINKTGDIEEDDGEDGEERTGGGYEGDDPLFVKSLAIAVKLGSASISLIQRKCGVGYNHAGKIMEWMEDKGYVSPFDGKAKARTVLLTKEEYESKYGPLD